MSNFEWWWQEDGFEHEAWSSGGKDREETIRIAQRDLAPGTNFVIMEARLSRAAKYEDADWIPFIATRNREEFVNGPANTEAGSRAPGPFGSAAA